MCWAVLFLISQSGIGSATDSAPVPLVIGETFSLRSEKLGENRRINIYFPPGFNAKSETKLPVLYMLDGGMAEDFLHVAGLIQVSVGNQTMRPFLLVGVENTERRRDLTGPTNQADDKKIAPRVGGSEAFRTFLKTELMPTIRKKYRTTEETAIIGESLAGLFVVETFLLEPGLFDFYFAFDPSLWWNKEKLLNEAPQKLKSLNLKGKTIFLAYSSQPDLAKTAQRLGAVLNEAKIEGLKHQILPLTGETHDTIYHPAALQAFRKVLAPKAAKDSK